MLHRVLARQLKRISLGENSPPSGVDEWRAFLERVNQSYIESEQDRYTLERSLGISSVELQELNAMKDRFFTQLSEELRIPISNILDQFEKEGKSETYSKQLVQRNAKDLQEKIDALLRLVSATENITHRLSISPGVLPPEIAQEKKLSQEFRAGKLIKEIELRECKVHPSNKQLILVVEPDPDSLQNIYDLLSPHFILQLCTNALQANQKIKESLPYLLIAAENLSDLTGLQFLDSLKLNPLFRKIPFLLLSSSLSDLFRIEAFEKGTSDYITRPFFGRELIARVNRLIRARETELAQSNELERVAQVQAQMISQATPVLSSCKAETLFRPAEVLSGDYFGWQETRSWTYFLLADVSGHGTAASSVTFIIHSLAWNILKDISEPTPSQWLEEINRRYSKYELKFGIGLQLMRVHSPSAKLEYVRANGPGALVVSPTGKQKNVTPRANKDHSLQLENGDTVFLFTDGCYELNQDNTQFGYSDFCTLLSKKGIGKNWKSEVLHSLGKVQGSDQFEDDMTIIKLQLSHEGDYGRS